MKKTILFLLCLIMATVCPLFAEDIAYDMEAGAFIAENQADAVAGVLEAGGLEGVEDAAALVVPGQAYAGVEGNPEQVAEPDAEIGSDAVEAACGDSAGTGRRRCPVAGEAQVAVECEFEVLHVCHRTETRPVEREQGHRIVGGQLQLVRIG